MPKIGDRYGRLKMLSIPYKLSGRVCGHLYIDVLCDCGKTKKIRIDHIKNGNTSSCGCFAQECRGKYAITHGLSNHPLYGVWLGMKKRCYRKSDASYFDYGGRGVRVCKEWKNNFKSFYDWAIKKWENGLHLDKDKLAPTKIGKLYSPEFCCFLSQKENNRSKRNTLTESQVIEIRSKYDSGKYTFKQLGEMYGRCQSAISAIVNKINWVDI